MGTVKKFSRGQIAEMVSNGYISQEKADEIYNEVKDNQISCDGEGTAKIGQKHNMRFGKGLRDGAGKGRGNGQGQGRGMNR